MMAKYDDKAVINKLKEAFRLGASIEIACGYAGIDESSYYVWQKKADNGEKEYIDLFKVIKGSMAIGDMKCLDKITQAAEGGVWQAAAWKLERRHPDEYGNNVGLRDANQKLDKILKDKDNEAKEKPQTNAGQG